MASRQADRLAVAVRSPIASEEDEEGAGVEVVGEGPRTSGLIDERVIGDHVDHHRSAQDVCAPGWPLSHPADERAGDGVGRVLLEEVAGPGDRLVGLPLGAGHQLLEGPLAPGGDGIAVGEQCQARLVPS